eukprot:gene26847-biopygen5461
MPSIEYGSRAGLRNRFLGDSLDPPGSTKVMERVMFFFMTILWVKREKTTRFMTFTLLNRGGGTKMADRERLLLKDGKMSFTHVTS